MADVLLDPAVWVAVFGFSRTLRVWQSTGSLFWVVVWVAACSIGFLFRPRGLLLVAGVTVGLAATLVPHNGFVLVAWLCLIFGVFTDLETRRLLVRVQATVVYLAAAANKLFVPFLSGWVLSWSAPWLPNPELVAPFAVLGEAVLGWAVWTRQRWAFPAAVLFHAGVVFGTSGPQATPLGLLGYNAAMVVMVWWVTRPPGGPTSRRARRTGKPGQQPLHP